jgi:hypothetical protein
MARRFEQSRKENMDGDHIELSNELIALVKPSAALEQRSVSKESVLSTLSSLDAPELAL